MRFAFLVLAVAALGLPASAGFASVSPDVLKRTQGAGAAHTSDWPCIQPKVPELSVAAVWSGPDVSDALQHWRDDEAAASLAARISARRMEIEEAEAAIATFAADLAGNAKEKRLVALFAGMFDTLNKERSDVMAGIERYARKQKAMAEDIREAQERLSDLNSKGDTAQAAALTERLAVEVRVFNDRRASLTFVCEVPTIIEQRLFALSRAIQKEMPR
jgi:hypothetical protein